MDSFNSQSQRDDEHDKKVWYNGIKYNGIMVTNIRIFNSHDFLKTLGASSQRS